MEGTQRPSVLQEGQVPLQAALDLSEILGLHSCPGFRTVEHEGFFPPKF